MSGIEIKTPLGKWKKVDEETAREFAKKMINNGANKKQLNIIHLRGTTVEELLKGSQ